MLLFILFCLVFKEIDRVERGREQASESYRKREKGDRKRVRDKESEKMIEHE